MSDLILEGKRALITGASGGIGAAIARKLSTAGAIVAIHGNSNADALATLAEELKNVSIAPGVTARLADKFVHTFTANLANMDEVVKLGQDAISAMGGVDILVNNAGLTRDGLILRMKPEAWQDVLAVNLTAPFLLSQAAMKTMLKQKSGGHIVNIGSVVARMGNPGQVNYVAAKAGLEGLTKVFAQEGGALGIQVNCVAPGFIRTAMTADLKEDRIAETLRHTPLGRLGEPADVAQFVLSLVSGGMPFVTGQVLSVNGGLSM